MRQEFQRRSLSLHSVNEGTHMSGRGPAAPVKLKIRDTHTHTHTKRVIALRHLIHDVQVRDNGQHHESVFRLAGIFALVQMETAVFFP